jgi:AraC family transcriptional regulator
MLLERARCELGKDRVAAGATLAMASALLRVALDRNSSGNRPVSLGLAGWQSQRVRAYIDDHLDQTIHVKDLSAIARRSAAHFSRAFKRTFGESPHAYIVRRRLDRATYLMLSTDAPLSEIALACGFTDQAHLSNLFRRRVGVSPAIWRREHRESNGRAIGSIAIAAHPAAVATPEDDDARHKFMRMDEQVCA